MSKRPERKPYSVPITQHEYINKKAVDMTVAINRPVPCRIILESLLNLCPQISDEDLLAQVIERLNEPTKRARIHLIG